MKGSIAEEIVTLETDVPVWDRFFTVSPLVLIGTREANGTYDLAPKHMAFQLGLENYFGFVCTPEHRTYHNAQREKAFTVSFPRPTQVVLASLAATPRCGDDSKPSLVALPTYPASCVDGVFIRDAYLFLECTLERVVDAFGKCSLIAGKIVAAHASEEVLRGSDTDDSDIINDSPLLAYLDPGRFARIRRTYSFPFSDELIGGKDPSR